MRFLISAVLIEIQSDLNLRRDVAYDAAVVLEQAQEKVENSKIALKALSSCAKNWRSSRAYRMLRQKP